MTLRGVTFLAVALAVLCLLMVIIIVLLRQQANERQFRERLAMVASPYARINPIAIMGRASARLGGPLGRAFLAIARVFGFDPSRDIRYPVRWWLVLIVAFMLARGVAGLAVILVGPFGWATLPVAWLFFSRNFFGWYDAQRKRTLYAQFPDALAMIVRSVRVGIPLSEGIRTVAREASNPTRTEFGKLHDQVSIGVTIEAALHDMAARNRLQEYRFFATALALQSQTGGGLTEALDILADVMRKRLALTVRAHALASEAKTSIAILAALPFVSGGALAFLNPSYIGLLFRDPSGQRVLGLAILSLGSGLFVMRSMIKRSLS